MLYITYKFFVWAKFATKIFEQIIKKCEHCLSAFDEAKTNMCLANMNMQLGDFISSGGGTLLRVFTRCYQWSNSFSPTNRRAEHSSVLGVPGADWQRRNGGSPPVFKLLVPIKVFKICKGSCWWLFEKIFQRTRWTEIFWLTWNICIILYTSVVQLSNWKNVNLCE